MFLNGVLWLELALQVDTLDARSREHVEELVEELEDGLKTGPWKSREIKNKLGQCSGTREYWEYWVEGEHKESLDSVDACICPGP